MTDTVAAVDLGASSGRVMVGHVGPDTLELEEAHRFPNDPVELPDGLHWDVLRLQHEVIEGLRRAVRMAPTLASVGVDGWGVDFGFVDSDGRLLGEPYHYRDRRTARGVERVHAVVPQQRLYERTGTQFMPINTIYQLAASQGTAEFERAASLVLIPDLIGHWLADGIHGEATNVSTTGLFDPVAGTWAVDIADALRIPAAILPPLVHAGDSLGGIRPEVVGATGLPRGAVLTAVGSHDTASSVVGVPARDERFAYISCGTWALVGVELAAPILRQASQRANFTNELGVDGRTRYLRNVMGLWLLQESMRAWERQGERPDLPELLAAATAEPPSVSVVDVDDPGFMAPGDMPERIRAHCRAADQPVPASRPALVRCILDNLALAFARAVDDARRVAGVDIAEVHIVGGGSRNELLCQLTADACGLPVTAGPVEATAIGNVLIQARAQGLIHGDLAGLRSIVRATQPLRHYKPAVHAPDRPAAGRKRDGSRLSWSRSRTDSTPGGNSREGSVEDSDRPSGGRGVRTGRPTVNTHVHLPPNFSAFETPEQAVRLAAAEGLAALGTANYHDFRVYSRFAAAAADAGVVALFGVEIIALLDDLPGGGSLINDPTNLNRMYLCGKALTRIDPPVPSAARRMAAMRAASDERMSRMTALLAARFAGAGFDGSLTATLIAETVAERCGVPLGWVALQERHVAQAFQERLFRDVAPGDRSPALERLFEATPNVEPTDAVAVQEALRSYLMKAGRPAFVPEAATTFDDAYRLILELGGVPCYPILADGATPICGFEDSPESLAERLLSRRIYSAELIPGRNRPDVVDRYVTALRSAGIVVLGGTEHNSKRMIPLEPKALGGAPLSDLALDAFWEATCVVAAHQELTRSGRPGYVDAEGRLAAGFADLETRINAFRETGAHLIDTRSAARIQA